MGNRQMEKSEQANWKVWVHIPEGDFGEWVNVKVTKSNPRRTYSLSHNGERFSGTSDMVRIRKDGVPESILAHIVSVARGLL